MFSSDKISRFTGQLLQATLIAGMVAGSHTVVAGNGEVYWRGNFSDQSLAQWSYLLNPQGISLTDEYGRKPGDYAAKIVILGEPDYLWNGNPALNRVELQYKPAEERTAEGADTYLGWSFLLPQALTDARHEVAYWESQGSYRQMIRFNIVGNAISFQYSAGNNLLWQDAVQPGQWHDVALHVHWSDQPGQGYVSVWFDGRRVVERAAGQTLFSRNEPMFTQIGILRDQTDLPETVIIDNGIEAGSIHRILAEQRRGRKKH